MRVVDYITHFFVKNNIHHIFGMSGANIEDLFSAVYQEKKITTVLAKNEYNAATMAMGSYLATKKIAAVLTTSGPGILNTLPLLAEAFTSKIPFLQISGLVPINLEGQGAFQDTSGVNGTIDILAMIKPCCSFLIKINSADEIPQALKKAILTCWKTKRPAVILIPKNILSENLVDINQSLFHLQDHAACPLVLDEKIEKAIFYCHQFIADHLFPPLVILGEELIHNENIDQLKDFIIKTKSKVALTTSAKGLFNHYDQSFLGMVGVMGHNQVLQYLKETQYLIIIGTSLELIDRHGMNEYLSSKKILAISQEEINLPLDALKITGKIEEIFSIINKKIALKNFTHQNNKSLSKMPPQGFGVISSILTIQKYLKEKSHIFIDAGNTGAFVVHYLKAYGLGTCYVFLGMGGMGNSIGAGIGSAIASKIKTYVFLGDGSFLMFGLEIHTALEHQLPIVFFIFNNNSHGMCSTRENVFLKGESGINNFRKIKLIGMGLANLFKGLKAFDVNDHLQLINALEETKDYLGPVVIALNISNQENPPFKTFIKNEVIPS